MEVDDPFSPLGEAPQKIVVIRSIRTDPLADMHARSQIDEAHYLAGRKYQELSERAAIGQIGSIDTTKTPVDGKRWPELVGDGQRKAIRDLEGAQAILGMQGTQLVEDVLVHGMFLKQAAEKRGDTSARNISGWSFAFRKHLETLAGHFGYATQLPTRTLTRRQVRIRSFRMVQDLALATDPPVTTFKKSA